MKKSVLLGLVVFLGVFSGVFAANIMFYTQPKASGGIGEIQVSYAVYYKSLKEAYRAADLVIIGKVTQVEYYLKPTSTKTISTVIGPLVPSRPLTYSWIRVEKVIKGRLTNNTVLVRQDGGLGYHDTPIVLPEDPPLMKNESVILFLIKGSSEKYQEEYVYHGPFGRFEVIDEKVYSAIYGLPTSFMGREIQSRKEASIILSIAPDYKDINGVPLETFIETLNAEN